MVLCVLNSVCAIFCVLGLCPDWETWDSVKPVENASEAMQLADTWLGIPQVPPLNYSSPHLSSPPPPLLPSSSPPPFSDLFSSPLLLKMQYVIFNSYNLRVMVRNGTATRQLLVSVMHVEASGSLLLFLSNHFLANLTSPTLNDACVCVDNARC